LLHGQDIDAVLLYLPINPVALQVREYEDERLFSGLKALQLLHEEIESRGEMIHAQQRLKQGVSWRGRTGALTWCHEEKRESMNETRPRYKPSPIINADAATEFPVLVPTQ